MDSSLQDRLQATFGAAYVIERELDGGGMARVFVAHDSALGRKVVVKTLAPDQATGVSAVRFRREIQVVAALQQANIVPVHSAGEVDGLPYYLMPFVGDETLRDRLAARGALSVAETIGILRDIARALAFAHANGVVHRDIKPANVLLSGNAAVVADFGIAKAIERSREGDGTLTTLGTALGTPTYISPEQAAGETRIDHRVDLYALGVVAYELLTGAPPFTGSSAQALLAAHVHRAPPPLPDEIPPALATLVSRCLEKDPDRRPASAAEVLAMIDAVATSSRAVAAGPSMPPPCVVVLPLTNLSAAADDEYFSEGMTDDIITQLAQIASLRVISRTSAMSYRRTTKRLAEIATELGATHVVEGSARRAGDRLRIVAHLVDAATDAQVWGATFDRHVTDVFAVQSEVALSIATALRAALSPAEHARIMSRPAADREAYDAYLLAIHHWNRFTPDGVALSVQYFERALSIDPSLAPAHAGLANYYAMAAGAPLNILPAREAVPQAKRCIDQALALNPSLALPYVARGVIECWFDLEFEHARASAECGVSLEPSSAMAWGMHAHAYTVSGLHTIAVKSARRGVELDPLSGLMLQIAAWVHTHARQYGEGERFGRRLLEAFPGFPIGVFTLAETLLAQGRDAEARAVIEPAADTMLAYDYGTAVLAAALGRTGATDRALVLAHRLEEQAEVSRAAWGSAALAYLSAGQRGRALQLIERAAAERPSAGFMTAYLGVSPLFDSLRGEPRFDAAVGRIGRGFR